MSTARSPCAGNYPPAPWPHRSRYGSEGSGCLQCRHGSFVLQEGIGDTIRVFSDAPPGGDRTEEVRVSGSRFCNPWEFAVSRRSYGLPRLRDALPAPSFRKWPSRFRPTCESRCLPGRFATWALKNEAGCHGCVVNGPGESKHAKSVISLRVRLRNRKPRSTWMTPLHHAQGRRIVAEFIGSSINTSTRTTRPERP